MGEDMADAAGMRRHCRGKRRRRRVVVSPSRAPSSRVVGTSVMPPSRPLSGALAQQDRAIVPHGHEGGAAPLRLLGLGSAHRQQFRIAVEDRAQSSRSGQSMQRGRRGVQMVAPRSIIACAKSPGRSFGTSLSSQARISVLASGSGVRMANRRAITRSTLPSTTAAGLSKAIAAIAAAV